MKRRDLLKGAAFVVASGLLGGTRALAFTQATATELDAAINQGKASGRPLLVIVVPSDPAAWYGRGHVWGEFLNHATDAQLAPVGLADVACVPWSLLKGRLNVPAAEVAALVFEPGGSVSALHTVPEYVPEEHGRGEQGNSKATEELVIRRRIGHVAEGVRKLLWVDGAMLQKRVAAGDALAARAQASLAEGTAALAEKARASVVNAPPSGAQWAVGGGCGTFIEGAKEQVMVKCGMGYVPELSARFLSFYAGRAE